MIVWTYSRSILTDAEHGPKFLAWCEEQGLPHLEITANESRLPYIVDNGDGTLTFLGNRVYLDPGTNPIDGVPAGMVCYHDPRAPHMAAYPSEWPVTSVPPVPSGIYAQAVSA